MTIRHLHHLKPRHRGGTDNDGLIDCSITQHAMFHFCEWKLHGLKEDYIAWKFLSGSHPGGWNVGQDRPEHSEKMSGEGNPMYGLRGELHPSYGHTHTEDHREWSRQNMLNNNPMNNPESRAKISQKRRGVPSKKWKYCITYTNGCQEIVVNLKQWCKDQCHTTSILYKLRSGKRTKPYKNIISVSRIT